MEEKRNTREDCLMPQPWLVFFALALGLIYMDPFEMGPLGGYDYRPVKAHDIAPYKEVMEKWRADNGSKLRFGRLEFVDEVFGPESLEFDIKGRGPYAGLADGRIVRWMGGALGWETFSLVSPNW